MTIRNWMLVGNISNKQKNRKETKAKTRTWQINLTRIIFVIALRKRNESRYDQSKTPETILNINLYRYYIFTGLTLSAEIQPKLDILPMQSVQKKPVGKSLMLTCRPSVKDSNLITDLRWRDNSNNTIMPKA